MAIIANTGHADISAKDKASPGWNQMPAGILLDRLDNVRQSGKSWRASCPAHDGRSRSTLSVCIGDDGRVLIHCFAGCTALEIVHAVGLELSDLFEQRITHATTAQERRELRQAVKLTQWKAALPVLLFEATVVLTAARQIARGTPLGPEDDTRLVAAINRIDGAKVVLCGR
jgi:hypothetical protein